VGPRIDEVEKNVFRVSSRINSTGGGNLVDMVRCARYLEIIGEEELVESTAQVGEMFLELLQGVQAEFPETVSNTRGRGLLLAFDLPDTARRSAIRQKCWDEGLATLACGPRSLRFRPSLIFSEDDAERAVDILRQVLASRPVEGADMVSTGKAI
ncbi:MAG: aminotransferase class III-fold pyridoxal phosphate-dependent enzyme, partial [Gemmatimonadota bacterium]